MKPCRSLCVLAFVLVFGCCLPAAAQIGGCESTPPLYCSLGECDLQCDGYCAALGLQKSSCKDGKKDGLGTIKFECLCIPKKGDDNPGGGGGGGSNNKCTPRNNGAVCERTGRCCDSRCVNRSDYETESGTCAGRCPKPLVDCSRFPGKTCDRATKTCVCAEGKEPCKDNPRSCCDKPAPPTTTVRACAMGGKEDCARMGGQCCIPPKALGDKPVCGTCPADICNGFGNDFCKSQNDQCCRTANKDGKTIFECLMCPPIEPPPGGGGGGSDPGTPKACYVNSPAAPCPPQGNDPNCQNLNPLTVCKDGYVAGGFSANVSTVLSCQRMCGDGFEGVCTIGCPAAPGFCDPARTPPCSGPTPGGIDDPAFDRLRPAWGTPGNSVLCSCRKLM